MKNKILFGILKALIPTLLERLTQEIIKRAIDGGLDVIEEAVASTENKLDDATILPICRTLRAALGVPDND